MRFLVRGGGHACRAVTRAVSARALLGRPVLLMGIRLGRPTDVVLERESLRAVGLEVACGDDTLRFLPFPAARFEDGAVAVSSALQLLDEQSLAFYRGRGASFVGLRGRPVERRGTALGTFVDVLLDRDGSVVEVAVERGGARTLVAPGGGLTIGGRRTASAA